MDILSRFGSGKRNTRFNWTSYKSESEIPTRFSLVLRDDEPGMFRTALLRGDFAAATELYEQSESAVQTMIIEGLNCENNLLRQAINEYYLHDQKNPVACIALADDYIRRAWEARGCGWGADMTEEQVRGFRQMLAEAESAIDAMLEHAGHDAMAWAIAIIYDMATGNSRVNYKDTAEALWRRGCEADSSCQRLHMNYIYTLEPKWGGSDDMMEAAVRNVMEARPKSHVLMIRPTVFMAKCDYASIAGRNENWWIQHPDEKRLMHDAYDAMQKENKTYYGVFALNLFAYCFWYMGEHATALDALERLNHRYIDVGWGERDEFPDGPLSLARHLTFLKQEKAAGGLK